MPTIGETAVWRISSIMVLAKTVRAIIVKSVKGVNSRAVINSGTSDGRDSGIGKGDNRVYQQGPHLH